MRIKVKIAYDGGGYSGWQVQPNANSIQGEIERALALLLKKEIRLIGSGRTDSGAHALGQVAHFDADTIPDLHALNGILPTDIRIQSIEEVSSDFHAQYSATGKIYHYHLWFDKVADPFFRRYRCHVPYPIENLAEAKEAFIGTHDFTTFSNVGSSVKTTVRTLKRIDIVQQKGGIRLEFEGNGFLYKMVRNIVGALLEKRSHDEILEMLAKKDRRAAGICAPAHALFLMQVHYQSSGCAQKEASPCADAQSPLVVART
ncbi:MAG: tRNA pseudouridine(38-40) synthase TruA [Chlamydiales bacterium]|nr:tRNA pseudouridine(38-40) synthase TruA [Chlamydiales bacterium]